MRKLPLALAAMALLLCACKGGISSSPGVPAVDRQPHRAAIQPLSPKKIQHVIIIVQENRSFNNLFYGYPGAKTVTYGYDSKGQKITLKPIGLATTWDVSHSYAAFMAACDGTGKIPGTNCRMDGFDKVGWTCGHGGQPRCPKGVTYPPYSYVPHSETAPYFLMAKQYVLADQMYASNFDVSSFVSHQYIIAGQASHTVNYPESFWGCPGGSTDKAYTIDDQRKISSSPDRVVCFDNKTLGDELDDAKLPWAFYTYPIGSAPDPCDGDASGDTYQETNGIWSAYQAIHHICYGRDWKKDVITDATRFLTDVPNGKLAAVTWITPTCANSDHATCDSDTGPSWVASLVNAVGQSKFWSTSAIFVFWDDPGLWYDPEKPAHVDYDGLGFRVPLLIISPYAKKGYVSHTHYEHGSILKFVEEQFGLSSLAASDKRANSAADAFDFNQSPRKFVQIQGPYGKSYFLHQPPDLRPPDTN
ncbi:MAG: alkaline phosphatase family protein [Candidatus Cybelea sp.]